jgi:hypothetical protein
MGGFPLWFRLFAAIDGCQVILEKDTVSLDEVKEP